MLWTLIPQGINCPSLLKHSTIYIECISEGNRALGCVARDYQNSTKPAGARQKLQLHNYTGAPINHGLSGEARWRTNERATKLFVKGYTLCLIVGFATVVLCRQKIWVGSPRVMADEGGGGGRQGALEEHRGPVGRHLRGKDRHAFGTRDLSMGTFRQMAATVGFRRGRTEREIAAF